MKVPRDLTGAELAQRLAPLGYCVTRQTGSHLRLTTERLGEHHLTIPRHDPLKLGTLSAILTDVAQHFEISRETLMKQLFPE